MPALADAPDPRIGDTTKVSILRLEGIRREIGARVILESVTVSLARGERVGLVGANGAGKTTLLEIIGATEESDGGSVHLVRGVRLGWLPQEADLAIRQAEASSVRALVRAGAAEVGSMERELAALESGGALAVQSAAYAALSEAFQARDGYQLDQRVEETLAGLGIGEDRWSRRPHELSGGEQTRVALARILVDDPDLLLLDEPTNHLDIAALEWLEAAMVRRSGALIVASHDRAFLDAVVTRTWELRGGRLRTFRGAYSAYLVQREAADSRQRREADARADAVAREEELVQRYRSQRKHVKMHEHERRLERLQEATKTVPPVVTRLAIPAGDGARSGATRSGGTVISMEELTCGFRAVPGRGHDLPVLRVERLDVGRGERIGLVGPNGAGKTTLLHTMAGQLAALSGFVRVGRAVQPAYLSQLRDAPLPGTTVLDAMLAVVPGRAGEARAHLARFLFRGDDVFKPVADLSGGERSRLELAVLGIGDADLLLLDEPTNHLDIPAREALEAFLRASSATLVLVSHDRRLLESVCGRIWAVAAGSPGASARVASFDGGYRAWRAAVGEGWTVEQALAGRGRAGMRGPVPTATHSTNGRAPRAAAKGGPDPRSTPLTRGAAGGPAGQLPPLSKDAFRREQRRVDEDLSRLGARRDELEAALAEPGVQSNFVELRRISSELADVDAALGQAEEAWLVLAERAPR
ncbi:ABC-F family ATP-binding cassette domain-containing protein [soil metagenome]